MSLASNDSPAVDRNYSDVRRASGLRLMQCRCRAGDAERPIDELHAAFSITVVQRGSFTYRTRAGRIELAPGWLMLGNQGEGYVCSHENSDGSGDDCLFLSLPAPLLEDALAAIGNTGARLPFKAAGLPPSPRVMALLRTLQQEGAEGFALEEAALAIVATVRRSLDEVGVDGGAAREDERARTAAQLIDAQGTRPLALGDLARAAGLSEFHLLRVFRRCIGITPHQYLMRVRLLRAIDFLRDTDLPVTSIAYESGWEDLSNFNRAFRRELGCSPREFRRADAKMLRFGAGR